jgi:hypothetical protein
MRAMIPLALVVAAALAATSSSAHSGQRCDSVRGKTVARNHQFRISYYQQFIVARDAATVRTLRRVHSRPDEAVTTSGLVVKRDGAIGWIWKHCGPIDLPDGSCFYVVHKADRTGGAPLDSGDIDPRSLTLHGSRMAWTNAGPRRSAKLR